MEQKYPDLIDWWSDLNYVAPASKGKFILKIDFI